MLLCLTTDLRVIEVPVNYLPRVGASSVTGDLGKAVRLGLRMVGFIVSFRLRTLGRAHDRPGARHLVSDTSRTVRLRANTHLPHVGWSPDDGDGSSPDVAGTRQAGASVNG